MCSIIKLNLLDIINNFEMLKLEFLEIGIKFLTLLHSFMFLTQGSKEEFGAIWWDPADTLRRFFSATSCLKIF